MKFYEKHGYVKNLHPLDVDVFKVEGKAECFSCDAKCNWVSDKFYLYVCSEECLSKVEKDYEKALKCKPKLIPFEYFYTKENKYEGDF